MMISVIMMSDVILWNAIGFQVVFANGLGHTTNLWYILWSISKFPRSVSIYKLFINLCYEFLFVKYVAVMCMTHHRKNEMTQFK